MKNVPVKNVPVLDVTRICSGNFAAAYLMVAKGIYFPIMITQCVQAGVKWNMGSYSRFVAWTYGVGDIKDVRHYDIKNTVSKIAHG